MSGVHYHYPSFARYLRPVFLLPGTKWSSRSVSLAESVYMRWTGDWFSMTPETTNNNNNNNYNNNNNNYNNNNNNNNNNNIVI